MSIKPGSLYSMHPGFAMEKSSSESILNRTGKTLDEWAELVNKECPGDRKEQVRWLKEVHGFGMNYAFFIADRASGWGGSEKYDPDAFVQAQYAGKKAHLYPIYEAALHAALALGEDVKACPGSTIVPLYRKHVFAQLKATSHTRVDLGLCLRGVPAEGRLRTTGGEQRGDRITHRIELTTLADLDDEALGWLRRAYDAASG